MSNLSLKKNSLYRFYEMLPGIVVWVIFGLSLFFTIFRPVLMIYFVVALAFFWMFKAVYMAILLTYSWIKYKKTIKINWLKKLKSAFGRKDWQSYYHLIFLATYKEGIEVIRPTFRALVQSNYPKKKFIIVLAGEERDKTNFLSIASQIKKEFANCFFKFLITIHPKDLSGEIAGKGSNIHWAGYQAKKFIDKIGLNYKKVIVSTFDIDTCVHKEYFAYLTYKYLTVKNPTRCSYQPIAVFNNNIWQAPAPMRVISRGTTFWLFTELCKRKIYHTFSSHSMSFKALVDVGFWQPDVVSEDSRIFLQCFNHYNGNYRIIPLYISLSMDTVYAGIEPKTIIVTGKNSH